MINEVQNVLRLIKPTDRVLDVGGGANVFPRANDVIDILDYEARRSELAPELREHFSRRDWHVGDVCASQVWQGFKGKEFDFVICSHVLEDVRDPIYVCSQLVRVGKAGYIETPSKFRECAKTSADSPITGWEHHRWIVDVENGTLIFKPKNPWINLFDFLGDNRRVHVNDYFKQFLGIHWIGSFDYKERMQKGHDFEVEDLFYYYDCYPYDQPLNHFVPPTFYTIVDVLHGGSTIEWTHEYRLDIEKEMSEEDILQRYQTRVTGTLPTKANPHPGEIHHPSQR